MAGLIIGEEAVFLFHPRKGSFDSWIAPWQPPGRGAALFDPVAEPVGITRCLAFSAGRRRRAESFDIDQLADLFRVQTGETRGDVAAQRMGNDRDLIMTQGVNQLGKVIDEGVGFIIAVRRPGAIAVAAQIGGNDVPIFCQLFSHPIPAAAVIAPAVLEDQRRRVAIAPIDIVQAQALRDEGVGGGSVDAHGAGICAFCCAASIAVAPGIFGATGLAIAHGASYLAAANGERHGYP